jgi:hypothetical protein
MKVRYIGAQQVSSKTGDFYKLFFSAPRESTSSKFQNDEGVDMALAYHGEKFFDMKCTPECFDVCAKVPAGSLVDLRVDPNPFNPRNNIIGGITAAAAAPVRQAS